jgi:hypothetical protein
MLTSKPFLKIVSIIKTSAANGLTLTEAMPDIWAVKVGRCDGYVNYRNSGGHEIDAYSNSAYALQLALKSKLMTISHDDDEEPTLTELLEENGEFSVTVAKKHGRLYYDMMCDGINCTLNDIIQGMSWFESEWIEVEHEGVWKSGDAIEHEARMSY